MDQYVVLFHYHSHFLRYCVHKNRIEKQTDRRVKHYIPSLLRASGTTNISLFRYISVQKKIYFLKNNILYEKREREQYGMQTWYLEFTDKSIRNANMIIGVYWQGLYGTQTWYLEFTDKVYIWNANMIFGVYWQVYTERKRDIWSLLTRSIRSSNVIFGVYWQGRRPCKIFNIFQFSHCFPSFIRSPQYHLLISAFY